MRLVHKGAAAAGAPRRTSKDSMSSGLMLLSDHLSPVRSREYRAAEPLIVSVERHSIDDDKGVVVALDGFIPRRTNLPPDPGLRSPGDLKVSDFTLERVDDVVGSGLTSAGKTGTVWWRRPAFWTDG